MGKWESVKDSHVRARTHNYLYMFIWLLYQSLQCGCI